MTPSALRAEWERYQAVRQAAREAVAGARAVKITTADRRAEVYYTITPSTYPDYAGQWQRTGWDDRGPWGHENFDSLEDAAADLVSGGRELVLLEIVSGLQETTT